MKICSPYQEILNLLLLIWSSNDQEWNVLPLVMGWQDHQKAGQKGENITV